MSKSQQFETFSIITKEEKVKTLKHNIVPNSFALEIITPLPGYYGSEYLISRETPGHVLFMTRDYIHFEDFFRMLKKIKMYLDFSFDASFASVGFHNTTHHAIRIRGAENFSQIEELQKAFIGEGVVMSKPRKIDDLAVIRIKKFLNLSYEEEGIYSDRETKGFYYIVIHHPVTWKMFEKVTNRIRHNLTGMKYDVALGVLFRTGDLQDVIRVYGENLSTNDLKTLQNQYQKALQEYL